MTDQPTEREWLEGIGERFEREHDERFRDDVESALLTSSHMTDDRVRKLRVAARVWLEFPTDAQVEAAAAVIRVLDAASSREVARAALEAAHNTGGPTS